MKQPFVEHKYVFFTYARVILDDDLLRRIIHEQAYSYIVGLSHENLSFYVPVSVRKKQTINIYLDKPMEEVFRGYNDTARNEIRRTEKMEDLRFTRNDGTWSDVYGMYLQHRKERGLPVHALYFLQQCLLFNAYWKGVLVSTITCYDAHPYLRIQNIFSQLDGGDKELRRVAGFAARRLVYEICKYGNGNGYQLLDMASANFTNPTKAGITQFKSSFGGIVSDEYTYTYKSSLVQLVGRIRNII